jgi:cbb3-type cytochrome oxidase subunit 1
MGPRLHEFRAAASAAHLGGDLRLRRQRADRDVVLRRAAHLRARLWGGNLAWFVFWGYQLFIVMAATGYLLGIHPGPEYAEPEWYVDLWLTIVWVAYLACSWARS